MSTQPPSKPERRNFLKAAALGAGLALMPTGAGAAPGAANSGLVPKRVLGRSGVMVSSLSMGTMFDTITNQAVLRLAMRLGITHWDSAESYEGGRAEQGIGQYLERNPKARENIFLVTKSYSLARKPEEMTTHLHESLARMKTSYVDTFYVHGIDKIEDVNRPEIKNWAQQAKASGQIKFFGFSAHRNMAELLAQAAKLPWLDNIMFSYNYRLMHLPAMNQAVQAAYEAGLGLVAMKTQGESSSQQTGGAADTGLSEVFEKQGFSPEQARLKAVWEDKRIASICSQMPNLAIMQANAAAAESQTKLGATQIQALQNYARLTANHYCIGCGSCQGIVEQPVPDIMRSLMYYQSYGRPLLARQTYAALSGKNFSVISEDKLRQATAACPQGVDIAQALELARTYLA